MKRVLVGLALAAVLCLGVTATAWAAPEPPYTENAECLSCHDLATGSGAFTKVDFEVGEVSLASCVACHSGISPTKWGHEHFTTGCSRNDCHGAGVSGGVPIVLPAVNTPYGYFATAGLLDMSASQLHAVHTKTSWPEMSFPGQGCSRCHRPAACGTCHAAPVGHDAHAVPTYPAVSYLQATGTGTTTTPSTCVNPSCHALAVAASEAFVPECGSCHAANTAVHGYTPEAHLSDSAMPGCGGVGCHSTNKDLLVMHQEKDATFGCDGCHGSTDPAVVGAIASGSTTCSSCHPQISETDGHLAQHYANPPLVQNGVPQYAYWTGSAAGGAYTSDCATCHTSNVIFEHMGATDSLGNPITAPRKDRFGNPLTCDTCHLSLDPDVSGAIATGMTNCDACHVVHGPIDSTHQSSFVTDPQMNCAQCHSVSLPMEHNGTFSATTPSGRVLVGCAVCHDYYEGERGQQVEDAIAAGDTACSGCHTIHGAGDHTATASADCVACHETGDAVALHARSSLGGCDVCHANPARVPALPSTTDCANCHGGLSPADPNHYDAASHAANNGTEGALACTQCHSLDMKAEHTGIVTCAQCHELKVDGFTGAWDKSCTACHPTKHADINAAHAGVAPAGNTCTGSYCHPHDSTDLRTVHTDVGCAIAGCHAAGSTPGVKECATCHAGYADGHKSAGPIAEPYDSCTGTGCHTLSTDIHGLATHPAECASCHGLDAEMGCVCHDKTQIHSYTTHAAKSCSTCHPSGTSMPHGIITPKLTTSSTRSQWRAVCDDCHSYVHDRGTCTGCHSLSKLHSLDSRHTDGNSDCSKCHSIPSADLSDPCITCHPKGAAALPTPGSGVTPGVVVEPFSGCTNCHEVNAEVHRVASHPKECVDCHGVAQAEACICHSETSVHAVSNHSSADCTKCHESGVPKPHAPITNKLASGASNSTWKAACDDCHSRPHDRGTCSNCHSRSGLHGETSRHVDSNSDCKSCHGIQSADVNWNCLACHTNLDSSSDGSSDGWGW